MADPQEAPEIEAPPESGTVPRGHREWESWSKAPTPGNMALVLKSVDPVLDSAVKKIPGLHPTIAKGEARRLAIQAVKSYTPQEGTTLSTHIFNHLKPMGRYPSEVTRAVSSSRGSREEMARYTHAKQDFLEQTGRDPSDAELQDILGINRKKLTKLHESNFYELAEGQLESDPDVTEAEDKKLNLWADYVYHDLNDRDRIIMDHKLGRNGQPILSSEEIAAKLGFHPTYVNRRGQEIANRILEGMNGGRRKS